MGKPINITFTKDNKELTVPVEAGSQAFSFMPEFSINGNKLVAAKINNELCSLDSPLEYDCKVEPVYNNTKEGMAVYRRSLCLLLAAAARKISPQTRLLVGNSICYGYYYTMEGPAIDVDALKKEMQNNCYFFFIA